MDYNTIQQLGIFPEKIGQINLIQSALQTPGTNFSNPGIHQLVSVASNGFEIGQKQIKPGQFLPSTVLSHSQVAEEEKHVQGSTPSFDPTNQSPGLVPSNSFDFSQGSKKRSRKKSSVKEESDAADTKSDGSMDTSKEQKKPDIDPQEKNRENARNTRLRKKVYIEKLKQTVAQLGAERKVMEAERKEKGQKEEEQQNLMFQIVQTWFFYRANGELDREKWSEIVDENCVTTHPISPYRSFDAQEVSNNCRRMKGIDAIIADTASLQVLTESLGHHDPDQKVRFHYYCAQEDTVVIGNTLMGRWMMRTLNAVQCGGLCELYNHGMLRAEFSPKNLMVKVDLMFDVMSLMQQLQRCSGREYFHIVPNTVAMSKQSTDEPRMVVSNEKPYKIIHVNRSWSNMFGYSLEEVYLKCMDMVDGGQGETSIVFQADEKFQLMRAFSLLTKTNSRYRIMFPNFICFYPLASERSNTSYFLLVFSEIK